jgi:hypothetical protein
VGSIREEQEICLCNNLISGFELYGTNVTIPRNATITDVKNAIQSISSVGQVTVASATAGTCCGVGTSVNFKITYDSVEGDVPLPVIVPAALSSAQENVKGLHAFVQGSADYKLVVANDVAFVEGQDIFVRVAAANSVGKSDYITPQLYPLTYYASSPAVPQAVSVTSKSRTELRVNWNFPELVDKDDLTRFEIQYDTSPTFQTICVSNCSADKITPIGSSASVNGSTLTHVLNRLVPGQRYYVRVRACSTINSDVVCGPYAYEGYPSFPINRMPLYFPTAVEDAKVTQENSTHISLNWLRPRHVSEGSNGAPVSSYTIQVASPVIENQRIIIEDSAGSFDGYFVIDMDGNSTRCIRGDVTSMGLEIILE